MTDSSPCPNPTRLPNGIDRVVLQSLIPYERWESADAIAFQLGQTTADVSAAIEILMDEGAPVSVSGDSYQWGWVTPDILAAAPVPARRQPKPKVPSPPRVAPATPRVAPATLSPEPVPTPTPAPPVLVPWGQPIAAIIRALRIRAGLSQNQAARAAGIDPAYVNRLEHGHQTRVSREVALDLAGVFGCGRLETDKLLYSAGLAPVNDWQSAYSSLKERLHRAIERAITDTDLGSFEDG